MAVIAINDLIGAPIAISTSPRSLLWLNLPRRHENASLTSEVPECDDSGAECEARHSRPAGSALLVAAAGDCPSDEDRTMRTRRLVYWWFRIVISGRFLEKFLVRRAGPTQRSHRAGRAAQTQVCPMSFLKCAALPVTASRPFHAR